MELITVPEAMKRLCVSRTTITKLIGSGALPSLRIGAARRIPVSAIDAYIESLLAAENLNAGRVPELADRF